MPAVFEGGNAGASAYTWLKAPSVPYPKKPNGALIWLLWAELCNREVEHVESRFLSHPPAFAGP